MSRRCPFCGAVVDPDSPECPVCDVPLEAPAAPVSRRRRVAFYLALALVAVLTLWLWGSGVYTAVELVRS